MKPEMAAWAKDYTPTMQDVKCKLAVCNSNNKSKLSGSNLAENIKRQKLTIEYKQVFDGEAKRVLVKGGRGTGKTLLCKKIAYDWAKGTFTKFKIILVVFVNAIGSFSSIEDAIVKQYCLDNKQEGILRYILKVYGSECLVVIDGIQEDLSFLQSPFNLLVTSGPLSHSNIESQFDKVCETQGFTENEVRELVIREKGSIEKISDIKPQVPPTFGSSETYNPMLVMFLCILSDNRCLDFSDKSIDKDSITLCDLCLRLIMFLSEKSADAICESLRSFGRIIFDTLQCGSLESYTSLESYPENNALLQTVFVRSTCGSETFAHETLQLFLGALFFVLKIDEGNSIDMIPGQDCTNPILMMNPLFLYFCLSLLKSQINLVVSDKERVYQELKDFVANKMNYVQFDLKDIAEIYPIVKYAYMSKAKDRLVIEFLNDALSECQETNVLLLNQGFHVLEMLSSFPNLTSVIFVNISEMIDSDIIPDANFESDTSELNVILQNQPDAFMPKLVTFLHERNYSLHFVVGHMTKPRMELCTFTQGEIRKLHIQSVGACYTSYVHAQHDLPLCQHLTHLYLTSIWADLHIDGSVFQTLSKSAREGKLPNLSHLSFRNLGQTEKKLPPLPLLFQTQWPSLTHLDLTGSALDDTDIQIVFGATDPKHTNLMPNLSSLAVSPGYFRKIKNLFTKQWPSLCSLEFTATRSSGQFQIAAFIEAVENEIFPNLTTLKLPRRNGSGLTLLDTIDSKLPKLHSLAMKEALYDVKYLANKSFVQNLCHLDLSYNHLGGRFIHLLNSQLPLLESLCLRNCGLENESMRVLAQVNSENQLPKLQHLDISQNGISSVELLSEFGSKWEQLKSLSANLDFNGSILSLPKLVSLENLVLYQVDICEETRILESLGDSLEDELLPSIKSIHIHSYSLRSSPAPVSHRSRIRGRNISIYLLKFNRYRVV